MFRERKMTWNCWKNGSSKASEFIKKIYKKLPERLEWGVVLHLSKERV